MVKTNILKKFLITEKSMGLQAGEAKVYVFKVDHKATKTEIKSTVEALFEVNVTKVNTLKIPGKIKFSRGRKGVRSDVKKAYVTLKPGQVINQEASV